MDGEQLAAVPDETEAPADALIDDCCCLAPKVDLDDADDDIEAVPFAAAAHEELEEKDRGTVRGGSDGAALGGCCCCCCWARELIVGGKTREE